MLVIFLILFTNALADSDEDKYVDLLPDAEKQQFIEKVARRILEDVESKENKGQLSGEISDEQLKKHNEYVKAILKQESENIRRKGEATKDREEEKPASEENLDVKPLENEKIADDPDLEQVDLTLRKDRREIDPLDNSTEFVKVEIISDEPPIIKRSVQNENDSSSDSESEEVTTLPTELQDTVTEEIETSTVHPELEQSTTKPDDPTTKSSSIESVIPKAETEKVIETNLNENNTELEHTDTKQNESIAVLNILESKLDGTETDGEDIQIKKTRRSKSDNVDTTEKTTESILVGTVDFGVKLVDNKTEEESNSTNTDADESTTVTAPPETTTDNNTSTTQDIDLVSVQSTANVSNLPEEEKKNEPTDNLTTNTLTSTLSAEGTDSDVDTTTSTTSTQTPTTDDYIQTRTEYLTDSPSITVATTEEMKIIVEDFTSAPKVEQTPIITTTTETPTKPNTNIKLTVKIKQRAEESEEETQKSKTKKKDSIKKSKEIKKATTSKELTVETDPTTNKPKVIEDLNNNFKQIQANQFDQSADKNFIELEKVYYNKMKNKGTKQYEVYEIPPNKAPFIQNGPPVTEQPYYVPVYNYSPNNAYYNPQNRLGPNADDDDAEISPSVLEDVGNVKYTAATSNNVDMEYSETAFDNQRKKFGNKQKDYHSIHKKPLNNSPEENLHSKGKVNLEDYHDSDYYFGRMKKDLERRENRIKVDLFPNSNENAHPFHSIPEMNLKDHVRAVRNILFQQKFFGLATTMQPYESEEIIIPDDDQDKKPVKDESHPFRNGDDRNPLKDNIAIDYYFGRMKAKTQPMSADNKPEGRVQQVGYIKNENNTKGLYMIDHFFKENVVNYIDQLKSKDNTFIKAGLNPATPLPSIANKTDSAAQKQTNNSKFRNEEKSRNAKLNQIAKTPDINSIKKVLNIPNEKELFANLKKMQRVKMTLHRRNDEVKLSSYLSVLKDMLDSDHNALKQYAWLGTTVDIQASFQKLFELVAVVVDGDRIHPADLEILKYVLFLHKLAKEIIEANNFGNQLRYNYALPKNKRQKSSRIIKEKGLLNRVWLYLRRKVPDIDESGALKNFNNFLMDLEDNLFNLHDAIKNVAKITKYRNQHWYQNLKELYLNTDDKHLLELLLHMCVSRLFGLVEESAKKGMEDDYIAYMKRNKPEAKKTLEELLFVMQIMDEINKNVE